jgi:hypothetical protein
MRRSRILAAALVALIAAGVILRFFFWQAAPYQIHYRHTDTMRAINLDSGANFPVEKAAPVDVRTYQRLSPDGRWIARWSLLVEWYWWQLEMEDSASGQVQTIGEFTPCDSTLSWSPDSRTIAFAYLIDPAAQPTVQDFGRCEIHLYEVDSGTLKRLTNNSFAEASPAFSPDGAKLAFTSSEDGYNRLYTLDLTSGERTMLTRDSFGYRPAWSPDGKWIAFMSNHIDWNDDIYIIAPDGTGLRRLTTDRAVDDYPEWVSS